MYPSENQSANSAAEPATSVQIGNDLKAYLVIDVSGFTVGQIRQMYADLMRRSPLPVT